MRIKLTSYAIPSGMERKKCGKLGGGGGGEERERERDLKTLFYEDCSLGLVKTCLTTRPCEAADD